MVYKIRFKGLTSWGLTERTVQVKKRSEAIEFAYQNEGKGVLLLQKENGKWVEFKHTTYCRRCGRQLTNPRSVMNGIGPECIKHQNAVISHLARSQTELDNYVHSISDDIVIDFDNEVLLNRKYPNLQCKCGTKTTGTYHGYPHSDGMRLQGYPDNLWVYTVCPKCGYQLSFRHFEYYNNPNNQ